jgi:hypothetical protein
VELRFKATHDIAGLITGLGLLVASFIGTGLLDGLLAWIGYKEYHRTTGSFILHVPIHWVWLVGVITGIAFYAVRQFRNRSSTAQGK